MARVEVEDDTGRLLCVWFNPRFFREEDFPVGREMLFTGKVDFYRSLQMVSPEHELADEGEMLFGPRILPIYPLTEDLNQNALRRVMKEAVEECAGLVEDMFDAAFLKEHSLPPLADAIRNIHFPDTQEVAAQARRRLAYDELFLLETGMAQRRRDIRREDTGISFEVTPRLTGASGGVSRSR